MVKQYSIKLPALGRGFHLVTDIIIQQLGELPDQGLLNLFIQHTSAGLCINENADPTVLHDFESIFNDIVPENLPYLLHTMEGPDDMPAHIKSTLTGHSITIPITHNRLNMGTWQGIYYCEFRNHRGGRNLLATVYS